MISPVTEPMFLNKQKQTLIDILLLLQKISYFLNSGAKWRLMKEVLAPNPYIHINVSVCEKYFNSKLHFSSSWTGHISLWRLCKRPKAAWGEKI